MKRNEIIDLVGAIRAANTIVLASHVHPDGDAIGSTVALGLGLRKIGKDVVMYNRDQAAYNVSFLPGVSDIVHTVPQKKVDVTILLDCAEPSRIGNDFPDHGWGETIAVVDHHKTYDETFASIYVRDVDAAATGELVYDILVALGVELDLDIAKCIYTTLMTDTGSFRYSNTSKRTFTLAGELVELGVDPWHITSHVYESQPLERVKMLPRVLQTLSISDCGRIAFLTVDATMMEEVDGDEALIDGFINYARSIRGVEVAVQLLEAPDEWRVSFRSRGTVDVSEIAAAFGGGGHRNAAGCAVKGDPIEICDQLTQTFLKLLEAPTAASAE